ncbi:hypothetical protein HGH93_21665 [Chitinophaga polysaccharea]|uniref:hypothetical protein n=1 Tax=Chitinophaga polysaccharea TaxID=1293035 RepID=UPI001455590D|nr:hypothetical protein [Chitinophaga polysaccharea]NLR60733.1 hypothetical protein [Chitinophaga polysaccharea]
MILQFYVNDSIEFDQNSLVFHGVTKHIQRGNMLYIWCNKEGSETAKRFYVGDKQDNYHGATYVIPSEIIMQTHGDESPIKLLPAASTEKGTEPDGKSGREDKEPAVSVPPLNSLPLDNVLVIYKDQGAITPRMRGLIRNAAEANGIKTFKQLTQKFTKKELSELPNIGKGVVSTIEALLGDMNLHLRKK